MESTNTRYVRRSNALLNQAYGPNFSYSETQGQPNIFAAGLVTAAGAVAGSMLLFPPAQWVAKWATNKMLPPGTGPSKEQIEHGYFKCRLVGISAGEQPKKVIATVTGVQDPGYGETSKMLAESGLALAIDRERIGTKDAGAFAGKVKGGVVTAASGLGLVLLERLRKAGMGFEVEEL